MIKRQLLVTAVVMLLLAVSGAAILAQTETVTPIPPPVFTDGRINGTVSLGGLAIFCVDKNGNTHVNTFQNGAITIWGIADQKYINLSAAQLQGNAEIAQMPSTMQAAMTEEAMQTVEPMMMTEAPTEMMEATAEASAQTPLLLARAATPNGEVWFFRVGIDQFALQGNDNTGKFFTYTWSGCAMGSIDTSAAPFMSMEMTAEPSAMMTPEATASS